VLVLTSAEIAPIGRSQFLYCDRKLVQAVDVQSQSQS